MGVFTLLTVSLAVLAIAPLLMPPGYSVLIHSVSESAAQGLEDGWVARLGFVAFGVAVLALVARAPAYWGRWARLAHSGFAVSMIAAAIFSHAPWDGSASDPTEDMLHSAASFGVGLSFTVGVLLVTLRRVRGISGRRVFDWMAIAAGIVIPLAMANVGQAGLVQRLMFLIAFVWYGLETARPTRSGYHLGSDR